MSPLLRSAERRLIIDLRRQRELHQMQGAGPEVGPTDPTGDPTGRSSGAVITVPFMAWLAEIATSTFRSLPALVRATVDTRGKQHDRSSC
jgi:hypothetical protein